MPTVFSGPGGRITFSTPKLIDKIRGVGTIIRAGTAKGIKEIAETYKKDISSGIRSGSLGLAPLAPATIRARLSGKTAGLTPARPIKRGTVPLNYTGVSAKAIAVKMRSEIVYEVSQPDNARIGYSRASMRDVAGYQEKGFVRRGRFTKEMLAFLHILFRKQGGRTRPLAQGKARIGAAYTSNVPSRPAWKKAREKLQPRVPGIMRRNLIAAFNRAGLKLS